ncbi:hypothetical protein OJF2_08280 [Aquisphaera giovannonii]|uniref:DUF4412 domain-containing protein n=1 Tax=Aquisphaera giovannonii TaxID=406548 RepID=A0A5B9VVU4_9BACT|nr:DUF6263 family protein [Aquisphaera giovannonii]QEH32358.1 hypothetical protein OJF2_08280 [Aquisphaera giovannonii]
MMMTGIDSTGRTPAPPASPATPRAGRWFAALALAAIAAAGASPAAPAAGPLRYRFKAGETLRYTLVQDQKQETRITGGEMTNSALQTVDMHWTVRGVDAAGVADMSQTIDRIRWKLTTPGDSVSIDSADPNVPDSQGAAQFMPLIRALAGAEFTFKMDPRGEMSDIQVPRKLLESIQEVNPGAAAGGMFSEEGLKNLIAQSRLAFPQGPIDKGATWDNQSRVSQANVGTSIMDKHYTFQGPSASDPRIVTFTLKSDFKVEPAAGAVGAIKIDSYEGKGDYSFDAEAGRIVSSKVTERLQATFTMKDPQTGQSREIRQVTQTVNTMTLGGAGDAK